MRRRWVFIILIVIVIGVGVWFWLNRNDHEAENINLSVDQSAVLTIVVRSTQDGNVLSWLPISIQRTGPISNQTPVVTTIQSNGSGTVTASLPFGQYSIQPAQSSRYVGVQSIDLRGNTTTTLMLYDRAASTNLNTNAS